MAEKRKLTKFFDYVCWGPNFYAGRCGLGLFGLQQVADFREQQLGGGRRRGGNLRGFIDFRDEPDDPEDDRGDDDEVQHRIEEHAIVDGDVPGLLRIRQSDRRRTLENEEMVGEINAAGGEAEDGGDDVLDQAGDDAGEAGADDDTDRQVDDIATHDEGLEVVHPTGGFD